MTDNLIVFIEARLADDETAARNAGGAGRRDPRRERPR